MTYHRIAPPAPTRFLQRWGQKLLLLPTLLTLGVFMVLPMAWVAVMSLLQADPYGGVQWGHWTTEAYARFVMELDLDDQWVLNTDYLAIFSRSFWLALAAVVITLCVGFPLALHIALQDEGKRNRLLLWITIPFWVNLLVRTYAWILLLRNGGLVEQSLSVFGYTTDGLNILYTPMAVGIGLVYAYLPFMVLPIYTSLEKATHCDSAGHAGHRGRLSAGVCAGTGHLLHTGAAGWGQADDDRQPDTGAIRHRTQLALWLGAGVCTADHGAHWHVAVCASLQKGAGRMSRRNTALWRFPGLGLNFSVALVFLYLPIVLLVALSFNANKVATLWTGFSLRWYGMVFDNPNILRAASNSLVVATIATVVATVFATMAALAMAGRSFKGQGAVSGMLGLPLLVPEIVTAVASLLFFLSLGMDLGLHTVVIAHVVFCIPFAYLPIRARLADMDPRLVEAASDLYASPWHAFRRVTLPLLMPGIISGAMLAFIVSLDDFVITFFVAGPGATTLPVYIFGMVRMGITPEVNALAALLLMASMVFVGLSWWIGKRDRS